MKNPEAADADTMAIGSLQSAVFIPVVRFS